MTDHYEDAELILRSVQSVLDEEMKSEVIDVQKIIEMISKYQSQPQLLDPRMADIVGVIVDFVRKYYFHGAELNNNAFQILYTLSIVRGAKNIIKFFSHEVTDLDKLLDLLSKVEGTVFWHARYVLLLWISFVIMLPFKISLISQNYNIQNEILEIGKKYLSYPGKERDAASIVIARLLSRNDVFLIVEFLNWAKIQLLDAKNYYEIGLFQTFCLILKLTDREKLQKNVTDFYEILNPNKQSKFMVKFAQRIALIHLKHKVPAWRHLSSNCDLKDEEYEEFDEKCIEEVINILLQGLINKDTVIRWSAAKGIGRITFRLPKEMAEVVCSSVLDLFDMDSEFAWHGGCTALAELARRRILLPLFLERVVQVTEKALKYHVVRGKQSIGNQVRDAACYVCWSLGRTFDKNVMQKHVVHLAPSLITAAVFDKDVNVRRAASAAFQENVGRQGIFPHGIDIVAATDYFTVGNITKAFLEAAPKVAKFPEYHSKLVQYLLQNSLTHVDATIRDLGSQALGLLAKINNQDYTTWFDILVGRLHDAQVFNRHGAALGLASLLNQVSVSESKFTEVYSKIITIPKNFITGFSSEITLHGLCCLITSILREHKTTNPLPLVELIQKCLFMKSENLHSVAAKAASVLFCKMDPTETLNEWMKKVNLNYNEHFQHGTMIVFESLHSSTINQEIVDFLAFNCKNRDAKTRQYAITALCSCAKKVFIEKKMQLLQCFISGLRDYTTSIHGDIGSWVRMSSMESLKKLCDVEQWIGVLNERIEEIIMEIFKESLSKINRVREIAGSTMKKLLSLKPNHVLGQFYVDQNWIESQWAFEKLEPTLSMVDYRRTALLGYSICASTGGESMEKEAIKILESHLKKCSTETKREFQQCYIDLIQKNHSIISTLDTLYCRDCFSDQVYDQKICSLAKTLFVKFQSNPLKSLPFLKFLATMACMPYTSTESLNFLISQLQNDIPRIRQASADHLMICFAVNFDDADHLCEMLCKVEWTLNMDINVIQELKNHL